MLWFGRVTLIRPNRSRLPHAVKLRRFRLVELPAGASKSSYQWDTGCRVCSFGQTTAVYCMASNILTKLFGSHGSRLLKTYRKTIPVRSAASKLSAKAER
jgi:hypothetical protein